jgi:hypothetical protein
MKIARSGGMTLIGITAYVKSNLGARNETTGELK